MKREKHAFDVSTVDGQKRLMRESVGHPALDGQRIEAKPGKDYGCNPLGNGKFEMVPSGDIVDAEEKRKRLGC